MSIIYFGGSRRLSPSDLVAASIPAVVQSVLAAGHKVSVGCAIGADALVIATCRPSSYSQVRVFAAFASGAGSWSGSAAALVQQVARAGVSVSWLAGGPLSVPLVARLMARSIAGLQGASAAVFFEPGVGSLKVASAAVARGIPVYAFAARLPGQPRGCAGQWVRSSFAGLSCWQWQSAQLSFA